MENSLCEKPERHAPRRLSDYLMLEGQKQKVHSLVDKVYSRKNLKLAWERVRANRGASGTDGITIGAFEANLDANLERLHQELRDKTYSHQDFCFQLCSRLEERSQYAENQLEQILHKVANLFRLFSASMRNRIFGTNSQANASWRCGR